MLFQNDCTFGALVKTIDNLGVIESEENGMGRKHILLQPQIRHVVQRAELPEITFTLRITPG